MISSPASRRGVLASVGGGLFTVLPLPSRDHDITARKRRKQRRKRSPPSLNAFGCVNAGQACAGTDDLCCSGVCEGTKPGKGKKDQSRCVARHALDCSAGADSCLGLVTCGTYGSCYQTTGGASFCAGFSFVDCAVTCTRDADCEATRGPGAACVLCADACSGLSPFCVPALI